MAKVTDTKIEEIKVDKDTLISADIPLDVEDERVPEGVIKVRLNKRAMSLYQRVIGSLKTKRFIPYDIDTISVTDLIPLYYTTKGKMNEIDSKELAKYEYRKWEAQTISDAYLIALTESTRLVGNVRPYDDNKIDPNEELSEWEKEKIVAPPTMPHDMDNVYELRLKLLNDVVDDQGIMWQLKFQNLVEHAVSIFLQEASEEKKDEERFHTDGASAEVHATVQPESEKG